MRRLFFRDRLPDGGTGTDVVCCGPQSPWVCATGGGTVGRGAPPRLAGGGSVLHIGFVTYATGPYNAFVKDLWASMQLHAFKRHDVHLYVFTDDVDAYSGRANVHARYQQRVGWPFDSLGRHFLFLSNIDWFADLDYIFSIDSDAIVVGPLDETMLGERVAVLHAWFFGLDLGTYPHDNRTTPAGTRLSAAYIEDVERQCYFAGGVFGGSVRGFRGILEQTVALAQADLNASLPRVALWHDESYLNRAFLDVPPDVVLAPNFMYPEPPVDRSLYSVMAHGAAGVRAYLTPGGARKFAPLILNLGTRKHVEKKIDVFQPQSAVIPAFMTSNGLPGTLAMPAVATARLLADVTFVFRAFERPACLRQLLNSLAARYTGARVIVLDDSKTPLLTPEEVLGVDGLNLTYVPTEYDVGMFEARRMLLALIDSPFAAVLEDDVVLGDASTVEHLAAVLQRGGFDIVGGCVDAPAGANSRSYMLKRDRDRLDVTPDVQCGEERAHRAPDLTTEHVACWKVDLVVKFFVGRVEALRRLTAPPTPPRRRRFSLGELEDFFLLGQQRDLQVAMCRGVNLVANSGCDASETSEVLPVSAVGWVPFLDAWGLTELHTAAGTYRLKCEMHSGLDAACEVDVSASDVSID